MEKAIQQHKTLSRRQINSNHLRKCSNISCNTTISDHFSSLMGQYPIDGSMCSRFYHVQLSVLISSKCAFTVPRAILKGRFIHFGRRSCFNTHWKWSRCVLSMWTLCTEQPHRAVQAHSRTRCCITWRGAGWGQVIGWLVHRRCCCCGSDLSDMG